MKKILVVDFNGTSSVYTHYLSKGLKDKEDELKILGKKNALHMASSRSLIFHRPLPAPFLIDHFSFFYCDN